MNWMLTSATFDLDQAQVSGDLRYTDAAALFTALGVGTGDHPNVFRLRTDEMRRTLLADPAIAAAQVDVILPHGVFVSLTERSPVFALQRGSDIFLVAADGAVLAQQQQKAPAASDVIGLPTVSDERALPPQPLVPGARVDPIDLAAILQLAALTPASIDSAAQTLALSIRDDDGFVLTAAPEGWRAVFGDYTPNLRTTAVIPRQVQCLRSLLGAAEASLTTIYLAPLDKNCGTYIPVVTPGAPTPAPTKSR